jgi:ABC-type multidrug transport system fused ATPase/permease subunit
MRRLLAHYALPQWPRVALLGLLSFGGIGLDVLNPQVMRRFVDGALGGDAMPVLLGLGGIYLAIAVSSELLWIGESHLAQLAAWTATNELRAEATAHLLRLDLRYFHRHPPGELIDRIDGDVTRLAGFLSDMAVMVVGQSLLAVGILAALFWQDWVAGLAFAIFCTVAVLCLRPLVGQAAPLVLEGRKAGADILGYLEERLGATEDLRANGAVAYAMGGLRDRLAAQFGTVRRARSVLIRWPASVQGLMGLGLAMALALGAVLYVNHRATVGSALVLVAYMQMLRAPLMNISSQFQGFEETLASVRRICEVLDESSEIAGGSAHLTSAPPALQFVDVSFSYEDGGEGLRDLSFRLEAGERLGVIGRTGSGKTTLTRLIFRFYDPEQGRIELGGADLRSLRLDSLRRHVGLVTQDVQVFHASVRDNVTFWDPAVSDDRVLLALHALGLGAWYRSLPDGLDTVIGAGGRGLSAGEAQLLAFIRVFLRDPGLVVLDEATSRLDPLTERVIETSTDRLLSGRTAVVVAHRLRTLSKVDKVLALADGRAVELGRRTELEASPTSELSRLLAATETPV